ncbi:AzlD domain-containing protein [Alsobacter sp. SYSU M60028]|uniref:AzlD domain-containing protein n=1 Tax=Alsobacter ponti TaxID=2962936 RepID=A0ABT1LIU2_9HYPH|nr:AzlD domain-containing protein [Alsobacter ponti]MCP8940808.1 AzlD domain-containing protein [Alsobacter ponti]
MSEAFSVSPGAFAAILGMTAATYLCRVLGVWLMAHVPLTQPVRDGLAALPGSIVVAVVLPLCVKAGLPAVLALAAAMAAMLVRRNELIALFVGLAVASGARAFGL